MQVVSDGFETALTTIENVLKPVLSPIESFAKWFAKEIPDSIESAFNVIHKVKDLVDDAEEAIKPIKWALDAVKCIFDKIVQPVIDYITHVSNHFILILHAVKLINRNWDLTKYFINSYTNLKKHYTLMELLSNCKLLIILVRLKMGMMV